MSASDLVYVPVALVGDSMPCPGCGENVTLHWADGWRNDGGYTCKPTNTTHSQHIFTASVVPVLPNIENEGEQ